MSNRECQWCGEEMAEVLAADGTHIPTPAIVCELCDMMPEMLHPMTEKEAKDHSKKVMNELTRRRQGK